MDNNTPAGVEALCLSSCCRDLCYVRSRSSPGDALIIGIAPDQLKDWMSGPPFLKLPESDWPKFEEESLQPPKEVTKKEIKSTKKQSVVSNC